MSSGCIAAAGTPVIRLLDPGEDCALSAMKFSREPADRDFRQFGSRVHRRVEEGGLYRRDRTPSLSHLRKRMAPERRARNAEATKHMLASRALHELRQAREVSQEKLARELKVGSQRRPSWNAEPTCMSAICAVISKPWVGHWRLPTRSQRERRISPTLADNDEESRGDLINSQ